MIIIDRCEMGGSKNQEIDIGVAFALEWPILSAACSHTINDFETILTRF